MRERLDGFEFFAGVGVVEVFVDARVADAVGGVDDFLDVVCNAVNAAVALGDGVHLALHFFIEILVERLPEGFTDEEHRHFWHFAFLHEDEDFGKFVQGAKAAREEDVNFAGHGEHDFAGEEVVEFHFVGDVRVDVLLVGELNVEADAAAAGFVAAFVGGLHDARAATSDDWMAVLSEKEAEFGGEFAVFAVLLEASGAENADALGVSADFGETFF